MTDHVSNQLGASAIFVSHHQHILHGRMLTQRGFYLPVGTGDGAGVVFLLCGERGTKVATQNRTAGVGQACGKMQKRFGRTWPPTGRGRSRPAAWR